MTSNNPAESLGATPAATSPLDVVRIREDFPILRRTVNGHPWCTWTTPPPAKNLRR